LVDFRVRRPDNGREVKIHPGRRRDMARPSLTPEQQAEAQRIYDVLRRATDADLRDVAELLAGKADGELFGATESQVRDAVHRIGAKAIETALQGREKGATTAPAAPAPAATRPPGSSGGRARRS
jgi:hypothetical protein